MDSKPHLQYLQPQEIIIDITTIEISYRLIMI